MYSYLIMQTNIHKEKTLKAEYKYSSFEGS